MKMDSVAWPWSFLYSEEVQSSKNAYPGLGLVHAKKDIEVQRKIRWDMDSNGSMLLLPTNIFLNKKEEAEHIP